ncbi:tetratricopeptide repeat protein [Polaribacter sp. Asnod6-C07]|uniref:tetratricopeptide repeat protein n=1 Tax=Polaribacter sp. Asnod6-C07 TaxID=3160582 RepID=UPI0038707167
MKNNRRNFLKLTSLSILATTIPAPFFALNTPLKTNNYSNFIEARELAKKAKQYFFKKEYLKSESFYRKCIELVPTRLSYYDNLKAVYGAQGKYIDSLELFKKGIAFNPQNLAFHDRMARSLMQLEIGNKKMAVQYKNGSTKSLLIEAKKIYKDALEISPNQKYLTVGLQKVQKKLREQNQGVDYRLDKTYKAKKKKNIVKHKKRFNQYSIQELENQLLKLDAKKRNKLFLTKDIENRQVTSLREKILILTLLEKKYRKSGDVSSAMNTALVWYTLAPRDSQVVKKLIRLYLKSKNYQGLIDFRRRQVQNNPNVWSYLGLIKAIQIGHKKGLNVSLAEVTSICNDLLSKKWRVTGSLRITILDNKAKSLLKQKKQNKAKLIYEEILKNETLKSIGLLNRIINGYAISLLKKNELTSSETILKSILEHDQDTSSDLIPDFIANKIYLAKKSSKKQLIPLHYTLYRVYKQQGLPDKQKLVLNQLLAIDSENKFAKKRS